MLEERTGFRLPEGSRVWAMPFDEPSEYTPAYETFWQDSIPAGTPSPKAAGWAFPLLFHTPAGRWGLITEAAVDGRIAAAGLAATRRAGTSTGCGSPTRARATGPAPSSRRGRFPGRLPGGVIVAGTSPASVVESTLVENLNPPSVVADTTWIKPGRVSWSWLFDPHEPAGLPRSCMPFVDLAAEMGWEYTLVDANWDIMKNGTIHDLIAYAKSRGVGVLLWYNSGGPHNVVTERPRGLMDQRKVRRYEFERLARWGVKGVKIDFFQSDKQNVIALYHEILKDAADFKIMVNFHGCTLPRGWSRTYPHLMSMEAVRGARTTSSSRHSPPWPRGTTRSCRSPGTPSARWTTRPSIFRNNVQPARHDRRPTRSPCPSIFESGLLHFGGGPAEYRELEETPKEFLRKIPVAWDETRFLQGRARLPRRPGPPLREHLVRRRHRRHGPGPRPHHRPDTPGQGPLVGDRDRGRQDRGRATLPESRPGGRQAAPGPDSPQRRLRRRAQPSPLRRLPEEHTDYFNTARAPPSTGLSDSSRPLASTRGSSATLRKISLPDASNAIVACLVSPSGTPYFRKIRSFGSATRVKGTGGNSRRSSSVERADHRNRESPARELRGHLGELGHAMLAEGPPDEKEYRRLAWPLGKGRAEAVLVGSHAPGFRPRPSGRRSSPSPSCHCPRDRGCGNGPRNCPRNPGIASGIRR